MATAPIKNIIACILLIVVTGTLQAQQIKAKHPNIIFILADDLGYADLGCYGQQKIETPHIDALAKAGLQFMQYYSGSTVCAPARTTFMTGWHTGHTPIRGNRTFEPEGQTPLADSIVTIGNVLQTAGYNTGAFGKWSLGFITTSGDPAKKGFQQFFGYNCQTLAHNYYPDHLWSNHDRIDFPENLKGNFTYSADLIHEKAMSFLNAQNNNTPFFLYLPYTLPHADVIVPRDSTYNYYIKKFNEEAIQPLPNAKTPPKKIAEPYPHAAYAAMVSRLDRFVGEIWDAVKKKGMEENTIIIFCSDNGPHKENGGDPEFFQNHGIYRGIKRDLYEGGIRVPFIACWKGKIAAGKTDQWLALWDMYPTFQQLAGLPVNKQVDGISIVPTLLHHGKQMQHDHLYWEFHENNGRQALRWKNWKLVKLNVNTTDKVVTELYDLTTDPSEKNNVALQNPSVVKMMEAKIKQEHVSSNDWPLLPAELKGKKIVND